LQADAEMFEVIDPQQSIADKTANDALAAAMSSIADEPSTPAKKEEAPANKFEAEFFDEENDDEDGG
jgi:dsDNA-specific endonuclease/ATPase MutS2